MSLKSLVWTQTGPRRQSARHTAVQSVLLGRPVKLLRDTSLAACVQQIRTKHAGECGEVERAQRDHRARNEVSKYHDSHAIEQTMSVRTS